MATLRLLRLQSPAVCVAILIGIAGHATADTIIQTAGYNYASHGTTIELYRPFDASLGTLTEVEISVSGTYSLSGFRFENDYSPPTTIAYNGFFSLTRNTDAGAASLSESFSDVLPSPGTTVKDVQLDYATSASFSDVSFWNGTSLSPSLGPDELVVSGGLPLVENFQVGTDDPRITVFAGNFQFSDGGTETITYVYQPFSAVPEPPSLALAAVAALTLAGAACAARASCARRRSALSLAGRFVR